MKFGTGLFYFFVVAVFLVLPSSFLLAQSGRSAEGAAVNLDLLIKQTEDLVREQAQILEDQEETLNMIQNLKIWVRRQ